MLTKDWFIALVITGVFGIAVSGAFPVLEKLEYLAYNTAVGMGQRPPGPAKGLAIVVVDEASQDRIGPWPWSRGVLAELVERLRAMRPRAIALQFPLFAPHPDPGLSHIRRLQSYVKNARFPRQARKQVQTLNRLLRRAEADLDADKKLARALKRARTVYLPLSFTLGPPMEQAGQTPPAFVRRHRLRSVSAPDNGAAALRARTLRYPVPDLGVHARGLGYGDFTPASDGSVRRQPLVLDYYGEYYPSLALLLAARSLNVATRDIRVVMGKGVYLGKRFIPTAGDMRVYPGFRPPGNGAPSFETYSFADVRAGKVSASRLRGKIVLVGATTVPGAPAYDTPVASAVPAVEITAQLVDALRNRDLYTRPDWTAPAELALLAAAGLYLILLLPRLGTGIATLLTGLLLAGLVGSGYYMMLGERIWLKTATPAAFLFLGFGLIALKRSIVAGRLRRRADSESVHSDRLLALTLQEQGQLDMAMDKARKLPVDTSVLELIYNLALDYERKRQFAKAIAAYDYVLQHDKRFRDAAERRRRAAQADDALVMGNRAATPGGTLILSHSDLKPVLGRYEIEKELGKGAMGAVYLGRDPKINRVVAIKTLALSEEFQGKELENAKERFFREAEAAGGLSHPNIVTIYDAGDEHDLAYIAMEYLQGKDLTHLIDPKNPPSLEWVLDVVHRVADALDYAHKQGVVHRDIKPANIMYNEEDDTVKVTDFGIARITASSRTSTGVVLGTPSYMSPEQLSGKGIDGRSDIFSLGVMMYELLTGLQPFNGDSMAALMYQITNKKHKDICRVREDLPGCVRTIIDKALQKDPAKRYQTGEEFQRAVERCERKIEA